MIRSGNGNKAAIARSFRLAPPSVLLFHCSAGHRRPLFRSCQNSSALAGRRLSTRSDTKSAWASLIGFATCSRRGFGVPHDFSDVVPRHKSLGSRPRNRHKTMVLRSTQQMVSSHSFSAIATAQKLNRGGSIDLNGAATRRAQGRAGQSGWVVRFDPTRVPSVAPRDRRWPH